MPYYTIPNNSDYLASDYRFETVSDDYSTGERVVDLYRYNFNISLPRLSSEDALGFLKEFHFSSEIVGQTSLLLRIDSAVKTLIYDRGISDKFIIDIYRRLAEGVFENNPDSISEIFNSTNISSGTIFNKVFEVVFKLLVDKKAEERVERDSIYTGFGGYIVLDETADEAIHINDYEEAAE